VLEFVDIPGPLDLVVLDPGALSELSVACRMEFIADLQRLSRPTSVHLILPSCPSLAPDSLLSFYEGWTVEEGGRRRRRTPGVRAPDGLVLSNPPCPGDATARRSTAS
jgi:hypothetical protein